MDRNQIIGLLLMMAFIAVYFTFFAPKPIPPQELSGQDSTAQTPPQPSVSGEKDNHPIDLPETPANVPDSVRAQVQALEYGVFASGANGSAISNTLENAQLRLTFNSLGGLIEEVELKGYKDYNGKPLKLVVPGSSRFYLFLDQNGKKIDLSKLYFSANQSMVNDTLIQSFNLQTSTGGFIKYVYTMPPEGYEIGFKIQTDALKDLIGEDIRMAWKHDFQRLEMDVSQARERTTVRYATLSEDVDYLSNTSESLEEEQIEEKIQWVSLKQKFFTSAIIADGYFDRGTIQSDVPAGDSTVIKRGYMDLKVPYSDFVAGKASYRFFFGPNDYEIMDAVAPQFAENINYGWVILGAINTYFILPMFNVLSSFIGNYGLIIMIMVFVIRVLLSPLTYRSHISMAKMRVMKPELDEIKAKYPDDMQKAQQEQMAMYQKVGVNPLSGCIPMLLQMPILISLFYFFPNNIDLRQKSFLWATDLSTYDSVMQLPFTIPFYGDHVSLFTLLMTLSTILYTWSNSQVTSVQGPMKSIQYLMPIMFLFFLNSYASGLTFYYFVTNMLTFGQTFLFKRFVNEEKIRQILDENKKRNTGKKKSKFQLKLEEAMKASQEAQKNNQTKKKKR